MNVESWRVAPLGEVCEISTKLALDPEPPAETEVSFVPMAAIDETEGAIVALEKRPYSEVRRGFTSFRENDVLFAKITPCMENGKAAIVRDLRNGLGFGSTEFYVLRAGPDVRPEWLFAFIRRPAFRAEAKSNFTGSAGQQRVPLEFMRRVEIPVPPLAEQDYIVGFLGKAGELRTLRKQGLESVNSLRAALFETVFSGADSERFPIRELNEIAEVVSGVAKGRKLDQSRAMLVPYIRVANVQDGYLDLAEIKEIEALPEEVEQLSLRVGDVLMTEGGDFDKLGRGAIWENDIPKCIHQNHVFRVRTQDAELEAVFFANYLQTARARQYFLRCAKRTTNLASINMQQLRKLPVPLPPLELQRKFVARASILREMQGHQSASSKSVYQLTEALLARAFSGELTARWRAQQAPQEPAAIAAKAPEEMPTPEPEAPPISVPQIIADRDRIYTSLGPFQRALFDRVAAEPDYFTAEEIAKEDAFDLVGVKRGLQLLAAAGFIVAASRAVNPSESEIFYVDSFRMPREEDDVRMDLVSA
ncbi:MAG TPA: restriction endonuclease subunit S [Chthoniobacterales bacterium]|nr:restriction endonuclease subunit S [Chthoniobacterales bacterium]